MKHLENVSHALNKASVSVIENEEAPVSVNSNAVFNVGEFNRSVLNNKMNSSEDVVMNSVLEQLISERISWENTEFHSSNERLYSILTACYELFDTFKVDTVALNSFYRYLHANNHTFKSTTHLMLKVIRVVFGSDSRRTNKYASALRILHEQGIAANQLKNHLYQCGGIEEVKRKSKSQEMPRDEKGKAALYGTCLGTIKDARLLEKFNGTDYEEGVLFLANYNRGTQEFNILRVIQNKSALKAVYATLASDVTDHEVEQLKLIKASREKSASDGVKNHEKTDSFKFHEIEELVDLLDANDLNNMSVGD